MLDINKIIPLLRALNLRLSKKIKTNNQDADILFMLSIYLYRDNTQVGKCKVSIYKNAGHIERIDIDDDNDKNKGYGSILLYAALCQIQDNNRKKCKLTGFPINYTFYVRNGFYDKEVSSKDEDIWHALSPHEKKEYSYQANIKLFPDKNQFQTNGALQIAFKFAFDNLNNIATCNKNIDSLLRTYRDEIYFYQQTKHVLSLYTNDNERQNIRKFLHSRFSFFNGFTHINGKKLFAKSMQDLARNENKCLDENITGFTL